MRRRKKTYQSERRRWKVHKGLKKGIAVLAAVVLFCGSAPVDIYAANTVTISTRKDFLRFAKNCTLDSWSAY